MAIIMDVDGNERNVTRILDENDIEPLSEADILEAIEGDGEIPSVDAEPLSFEDILDIMRDDADLDYWKNAQPMTPSDILECMHPDIFDEGNPDEPTNPPIVHPPVQDVEYEEISNDEILDILKEEDETLRSTRAKRI